MRFRPLLPLAGAGAALALAAIACNSVLGIAPATLEAEAGTAFSALDECSSYCSDMSLSCPQAPNQEYIPSQVGDGSVCPALCGDLIAQFDEANLGNQVNLDESMPMDNSIACRIWHANVAGRAGDDAVLRQTHCSHAGPLGGTMCGQKPCQVFCYLSQQICGTKAYDSPADCTDACEADAGGYPGYRYDPIGTAADLDRREPAGNTLNCRMYHLENYLATGMAVHCTHASKSGGGICVDSDE
jgi:hypothetical protein